MPADLVPLLPLAAVLLAAGAVAGVIAGLLGVGGGIVIVPVLYHLFTQMGIEEGVRMKVAVGTSLATIVATAWSSARSHWKRGTVDTAFLRSYGPVVLGGVLIGSLVAAWARGVVLTSVFAAVALAVALHMALGNPSRRLGEEVPGGARKLAAGTLIGAVSAMMGIGGGTLSVPFMTAYGTPVHRAVGTAAAMGFIIGVPGAAVFALGGLGVEGRPPGSLGYVSLIGLALIAPASMLLAPVGARLAHGMDTRLLKRVFAGFLALTSLRMVWSLIG